MGLQGWQKRTSEVKDDLSKHLRLAESEEIAITRHGKPAGVLIGIGSEDDWFDDRLTHDPRFLRRIETADKPFAKAEASGSKRSRSEARSARQSPFDGLASQLQPVPST